MSPLASHGAPRVFKPAGREAHRAALTPEQAGRIPEVQEMLKDPPDWMKEWSQQVGAELSDGLRGAPGFIAFVRANGTVYHTYT